MQLIFTQNKTARVQPGGNDTTSTSNYHRKCVSMTALQDCTQLSLSLEAIISGGAAPFSEDRPGSAA